MALPTLAELRAQKAGAAPKQAAALPTLAELRAQKASAPKPESDPAIDAARKVLELRQQDDELRYAVGNLAAGALRGAGSIGATILDYTPMGIATKAIMGDDRTSDQRRQAMTDVIRSWGSDVDSGAFTTGKVGTEVAGTMAVPGMVGTAAGALGASPAVVNALAAGGFGADGAAGLNGIRALLARMSAGALTGGAMSGVIDPSTAPEGAAWGAVIPAGASAVNAAARGTSRAYLGLHTALDPKGATYLDAAAGRPQDLINALRDPAATIVPGTNPTAAQAAAPLGMTKFQALARQSTHILPDEYLNRLVQWREAIASNFSNLAKGRPELEAAERARSAASGPLYKAADRQVVNADPVLEDLMNRPALQTALAAAEKAAGNKKIKVMSDPGKPAQVIQSKVLGPNGQPLPPQTIPAVPAKFTMQGLHLVKQKLDDMVRDPAQFGLGHTDIATVNGLRKQLIDWMIDKSPDYAAARTVHGQMSQPINQMMVGQYLEGKLLPVLGEKNASLRSGVFAGAVNDAAGTVRKAGTGAPVGTRIEDILTPGQMKIVNDTKAELAREASIKEQASAGMKSEVRIDKAGTEKLKMLEAPHLLLKITTLANDLFHRMKGTMDQRVAVRIATELLDPQTAAAAVEKAMLRQQKAAGGVASAAAKLNKVQGAVASPALPQALNALSAQRQQQNNNRLQPR